MRESPTAIRAIRASLLLAVGVAANLSPLIADQTSSAKLERAESNPDLLKVSSDLLAIRSQRAQGRTLAEAVTRFPRVPTQSGRVVVEVRLTSVPGDALVDKLARAGLDVTGSHPKIQTLIGRIAPSDLHRLAALPEVRLVRPSYPPLSLAGATSSQGDTSIRSSLARSSFGVDGSGVTVGIISDSFARTASVNGILQPSNPEICPAPSSSSILTSAQAQASGDLPSEVRILDDCDSGSANCSIARDEGAALGEIVHDLAPGSELMFHSGFNSRQDFAEGVDELVACGADVIVDDLLYLVEPMFQDGLIAQAVDRAKDSDVAYFASAGNQASFGISEFFDDYSSSDEEDDLPSGIDFHHFADSADPFAAITVPPSCGFTAVLQWSEPFDVPLGSGAATDLDLYVCEGEGGGAPDLPPFHPSDDPCQIYSQDAQGCGAGVVNGGLGDPVEVVDYLNTSGASKTVYLAVDHYCGDTNGDFQEDDAVDFRVVTFGYGCNLSDPGYDFEASVFDAPQIYGHAASRGASAVGSVFFSEIDSNGLTDPPLDRIDVEPYSSAGGSLPIYFDGQGIPLPGAPELRLKPDLAAPDGVNTTFFGTDISADPDPYPNFFGSSAAAPHASAVAALVLEANPYLTRDALTAILASTARDIESVGWDVQSGHGLIDALDAVDLALPDSTVTPSAHAFGGVGVGESSQQIFSLTNTTPGPAALWVASIELSDSTNFSLDTNQGPQPCGSDAPTLTPGQSCTFEVSFTPTELGPHNASLDVTSNGPGSQLSLQGLGTVPILFADGFESGNFSAWSASLP